MSDEIKAPRKRFGAARKLARTGEFAQVRVDGKAQRGAFLILGVLDTGAGGFRAGFVTSKRVGGAVVRNRVRRRLREIVRGHQAEIRSGVWIVLIARPAAAAAPYRALEDEWLRLAKRAFILAPSCA